MNPARICSVRQLLSEMTVMDLQHGCRSQYGPLLLRIDSTRGLNGFLVCIEDPRLNARTVYQQAVQSTLEAAKAYLILRAQEYLKSWSEAGGQAVRWRCS